MKGKIHFRNLPFSANVGNSTTPSTLTPIVYDEFSNCGLGILYESGAGSVWGMFSPRDLITAWRGTEILRQLTTIECGTLCNAYYTGQRNPHHSEMESYITPMIEKIGKEKYDEIMKMQVPEEIIRAILDNQKEEFPPNLYPIASEVRAGTIAWRQEFADAGIEHPDVTDVKIRAQEATIAKFEKLLTEYSKYCGLSRKCLGMNNVESGVLTITEKDPNHKINDLIVVGLAGVIGNLAAVEFSSSIIPGMFSSQEDYDQKMERHKIEEINKSAEWVASKHPIKFFSFFFGKDEKSFSFNEAKTIIGKLFEEYFPKKETVPA